MQQITDDALFSADEQFCGCEYGEVEEILEELDEGHDGKAKPQTEHSARVGDVLQQLKQ